MTRTDWKKWIRSERNARGWTQTKLAETMIEHADEPLAKKSSLLRSIKGWETGDHAPERTHQRALTAAFNSSPRNGPPSPNSDRELATIDFVAHLAEQSGRSLGEVYELVVTRADELAAEPKAVQLERIHRQKNVRYTDLTDAVVDYYQAEDQIYRTNLAGVDIRLPIMVLPEWRNMNVDMLDNEVGTYDASNVGHCGPFTGPMFAGAIERLAEVEANSKVLYDNPIYRLASIDAGPNHFKPTFGRARFADYPLGCGLMEQELAESLATGAPTPIRDHLLSSAAAALNLGSYVCTGGPVALFAAARPARGSRPPDYALLLQVRGSQVMDVAGRLSTMPKGWHQPAGEIAAQANLFDTLMRELEEELLGAEELELKADDSKRTADPLHARARHEAVQPFFTGTEGFHVGSTGIGINLLSGTFEAPCLITIDDERWWEEYGHAIGGNWETSEIEVHSSASREGIASLAHDPRWVFEGLFALAEGLRVLGQTDTNGRVAALA